MLIGISGRIGSGKDTVAKIISDLSPACKWEVRKFAGKLKEIASVMLGVPVEMFEDQEFKKSTLGREWDVKEYHSEDSSESYLWYRPMTVREFLQKLGTEAIRNGLHTNAWVNALFVEYDLQAPIGTCARDGRYKHGGKHTKIWSVYNNMKSRCYNQNNERYPDYGGRGITICDEWLDSFMTFRSWAYKNGYNDLLTIDRKDNDKGYSPDNCRVVPCAMQNINQRTRRDNTSGFRGVSKSGANRWRAYISVDGKLKVLGYFGTPEEASRVYEAAAAERLSLYSLKHIQSGGRNWLLSDMRFPNEMQGVKDRGGICIRIERSLPQQEYTTLEQLHPSETALDNMIFDYIIHNNGTLEGLEASVRAILRREKIIN